MGGWAEIGSIFIELKRSLTVDWISFLLSGSRRHFEDRMHHNTEKSGFSTICAMIYQCCAVLCCLYPYISNGGLIWQCYGLESNALNYAMITAQGWHQFSLAGLCRPLIQIESVFVSDRHDCLFVIGVYVIAILFERAIDCKTNSCFDCRAPPFATRDCFSRLSRGISPTHPPTPVVAQFLFSPPTTIFITAGNGMKCNAMQSKVMQSILYVVKEMKRTANVGILSNPAINLKVWQTTNFTLSRRMSEEHPQINSFWPPLWRGWQVGQITLHVGHCSSTAKGQKNWAGCNSFLLQIWRRRLQRKKFCPHCQDCVEKAVKIQTQGNSAKNLLETLGNSWKR